MDPVHPPAEPPLDPTDVRGGIVDRRPLPRGGLPRQVQAWIMVGIAFLILAVILITGRPEPGAAGATASAPSATIAPERVRDYQARLTEQEARLRDELATALTAPVATEAPAVVEPVAVDPLDDERRRRDYESLFADNVAFSRRTGPTPTPATVPPLPFPSLVPAPGTPTSPAATATPVEDGAATAPPVGQAGPVTPVAAAPPVTPAAAPATGEPQHTLLEGTVIETVLVNRLDGTFQGPVQCLVTTPVYSQNRQDVVIPAGARILGAAAPVRAWGDTRLAVTFHRLLMPDGHTYTLDSFTGLNQVGETGLRDEVDRHYLQVFGASLAIGAISGLAQFGTRGGFDASFPDAARQSTGASLATSTARVLDRYLNVLPTVTIREGHRIKVVLTNDLALPAYPDSAATSSPSPSRPASGGSR